MLSTVWAPGHGRKEDLDEERNTASVLLAKYRFYNRKWLSLTEGKLLDLAFHVCWKQKQSQHRARRDSVATGSDPAWTGRPSAGHRLGWLSLLHGARS